jgi:hypothetical protein
MRKRPQRDLTMDEASKVRVGGHLLAEDLTPTKFSIDRRYDWFRNAHVRRASWRQYAGNIGGNLPNCNSI